MRIFHSFLVLFATLSLTVLLQPAAIAQFRAGVAAVDITPQEPIWLSGYASRTKPSEGVLQPIFAKALAIESEAGGKLVIITADLIGAPGWLTDLVAARLMRDYGLQRSQILFNFSHTHTGPMIERNLGVMLPDDPVERKKVKRYTLWVADRFYEVAAAALATLSPVTLSFGRGKASFAVNRRQKKNDRVDIGVNLAGPVDHGVPVLKITGQDGKIIAVVFGYACHNTTLTGEHYQISGDYAGFAQHYLEEVYPGATALFLALCGGDQNPNPRGTVELAQRHGRELAEAVQQVLAGEMKQVSGKIQTAFMLTSLPLQPYDEKDLERMLADSSPFRVKMARSVLERYRNGEQLRAVQYPVQLIRFDRSLSLVALGGEVLVGYALAIKQRYDRPEEPVVVAGYSNDVMCYIPTKQALREGGYEPVSSMTYYGFPVPFQEEVENIVLQAVSTLFKRLNWPN